MNKYEKALNNIETLTTKAYTDVCYKKITKYSMMKIEEEVYSECKTLQKLVDKATPKTVADIGEIGCIKVGGCPTCGENCNIDMKYCDTCGQALKWSETDE